MLRPALAGKLARRFWQATIELSPIVARRQIATVHTMQLFLSGKADVYRRITRETAVQFLRFQDLKDRRIVSNRVTLARWIAAQNFPKPVETRHELNRVGRERGRSLARCSRRRTAGGMRSGPPQSGEGRHRACG